MLSPEQKARAEQLEATNGEQDRPPFPLVWDNTMRSHFVSCPRKFQWEYGQHWKSPWPNIHLHAGKAWASALEAGRRAFYIDGKSEEDAHAAAYLKLVEEYGDFDSGKENKSLNRLGEALIYYFTAFPLSTDPAKPYVGRNGPMIEFSFALPLADDLLHPETGEPIIYAGRADMIATFAGAVTVYDDKTTSALGASWAKQWDLRSQFSGYTWAAQQFGIHVTQVLVRGIAILKTEIKHAQAITGRPPHAVERWHEQAVRDIRRAISCWKEDYWDFNLAESCSSYGGCIFSHPCQSANPQEWIEGGNYIQKIWDPVNRTEETKEQP